MQQYVYLIIIDNHNSDPEYIVCGSMKAADRVMEEIIRDRYIRYTDADFEKEIEDSVAAGFYESEMGDMIIVTREPVRE